MDSPAAGRASFALASASLVRCRTVSAAVSMAVETDLRGMLVTSTGSALASAVMAGLLGSEMGRQHCEMARLGPETALSWYRHCPASPAFCNNSRRAVEIATIVKFDPISADNE